MKIIRNQHFESQKVVTVRLAPQAALAGRYAQVLGLCPSQEAPKITFNIYSGTPTVRGATLVHSHQKLENMDLETLDMFIGMECICYDQCYSHGGGGSRERSSTPENTPHTSTVHRTMPNQVSGTPHPNPE